jgi:hypothetical protein
MMFALCRLWAAYRDHDHGRGGGGGGGELADDGVDATS